MLGSLGYGTTKADIRVILLGRNWVINCFQQLRSYRDEIETHNQGEILFSS